MEILLGGSRIDLPGGGELRILDQLGGSRSDMPGGGELKFCDPLGRSRSDLPGGGESELCDLFGGRKSIFFARWWRNAAPRSIRWKQIAFARWWCVGVCLLICSVVADRFFLVVA